MQEPGIRNLNVGEQPVDAVRADDDASVVGDSEPSQDVYLQNLRTAVEEELWAGNEYVAVANYLKLTPESQDEFWKVMPRGQRRTFTTQAVAGIMLSTILRWDDGLTRGSGPDGNQEIVENAEIPVISELLTGILKEVIISRSGKENGTLDARSLSMQIRMLYPEDFPSIAEEFSNFSTPVQRILTEFFRGSEFMSILDGTYNPD